MPLSSPKDTLCYLYDSTPSDCHKARHRSFDRWQATRKKRQGILGTYRGPRLYDNESWNDPRDFGKLVKAISLSQDVLSTSNRRLVELENQVQRLIESHLAPKPPVQVNKIASSCKICDGPHDTQYCMENLKQAFVDYTSSRNNRVGVRKEDEPKETKILESCAIDSDDHNLVVEDKKTVKKEPKVLEKE
nr:MAK10-like protein [Tanacetum cinerariifolium]